MKTRCVKYVIAMLLFLPSVGAVAQNQSETDPKTLEEFLKFQYDNMVYVEGGTYLKGEGQVPTTVGSFYCCRYETVKGLYRLVMDLSVDEDERMRAMCGPNWTTIQTFISKLNTLTGKRYRLLTDSEWEYAARGGNKSKGYLYAGSNNIDDVAWYMENLDHWTLRVGTKQPNELGLYDMSGNVEEWCLDSVSENVNAKRRTPVVDVDSLPDPPDFGIHRYVRGGGFMSDAEGCTVYAHYGQASDWGMPTIGFRLAMDVDEYGTKAPKFRIGLKTDVANSEIDCDADYIEYNPQTKKFLLPLEDDGSGGIATELDIAQVDYISRATVSTLRLPEGMTTENIVLRGDDKDVEVGEDGSFESEAGSLIAYNNDNLMYLNLSPGRFKGQRIALNGIETAASMITMIFPDAYQEMSLENFTLFKILLAHLKETKALGDAIDKTVAAKGYFEKEDIQEEYDAVVARLLHMANADTPTTNYSPLRRAPREPAFLVWDSGTSFPPRRADKVHGNGYYVELNKSTWLPDGTDKEQKPLWQCEFTVYNGSRYCYMFVIEGYQEKDGKNHPSSSDFFDMFRYVVKPQGISKLMDFGTVNDLAEMKFLTEPIESVLSLDFDQGDIPIKSEVDFSKVEALFKETLPMWGAMFKGESYDTTWDKVKKSGIKLDFDENENRLLVLGPHDGWMLRVYNFMMKIVIPAFKLYKGASKLAKQLDDKDNDEDEELDWGKFIVEYIKDLEYTDTDFYVEVKEKFEDSNVSMKDFTFDLGKKFVESIAKFAAKKGDKLIEEKVVNTKVAQEITKMMKEHSTALSEMEMMFKFIKLVYNFSDLILGVFDFDYSGEAFYMQFDFNQPQGGIDPIPGEDL